MRATHWLHFFAKEINSKYPRDANNRWTNADRTKFMRGVLKAVGDKMDCYVRQLGSAEFSGEYLGIDAIYFNDIDYKTVRDPWDPFVLPSAAVELENSHNLMDVSYSLWKLLCVRISVRVLICYQKDERKVDSLRKDLENVIWQGSLMKGADGNLLIIIGDKSKGKKSPRSEHFRVFEWRSDNLRKIDKVFS